MRTTHAFILTIGLVTLSIFTVAAQQPRPAPQPASTTAPTPAMIEEAMKAYRADLQGSRADLIAKNITLTSEQAAKFWPAFDQYQKEQNVIMDEQLRGVQRYADAYAELNDADALALMKAHLERDAKMNDLRLKWLTEFQKVVPAKIAARVMQIDRRLSLAYQAELTSRIPLIH